MNGAASFTLMFRSLSDRMSGYSFPCNARGQVDLDLLDDGSRNDYFFARVMVGRATSTPQVIEPARARSRGDAEGANQKGSHR